MNSLPSLLESLKSGDLFTSLESLRDEIAADLEACESMRDKAALYTRLTDVLARLEEVKPVQAKGDVVDEIASRRAARRTGASAYSSRTPHTG